MGGNLLQHLVIDDVFRLGTIQVYQMQSADAIVFKSLGYIQWTVGVYLPATVVPL